LIKFLTHTYLFTALGAGFLYAESCYHLNIDIYLIPNQLLFIVLATLGLYNLIQILPSLVKKSIPKSSYFYINAIIGFLSLIFCLWFVSDLEYEKLLFIGHLCLIGVAYSIPVFGTSLRHIPFIKTILIVYVWTAATVILPIKLNFWNSEVLYSVLLNRLVFVSMISLAFDISHQSIDVKDKLATLPTVFGNKVSYLAIPLGLMGIATSLNVSAQYGVIMAVIDFSTAILLFQSPSLCKVKIFELVLDASMFLKFTLLFLSSLL
jgi:hypothetical protein